jgi:hypothetical protein
VSYLVASSWIPELMPPLPTITASSIPLNIDEVATIIGRTSLEIDAAAAQAGYAVPIASCVGLGMIEQVCEYGAGWKVLRKFFPNQGGPANNVSLASEYRDAYQAALAALRKGEMPIIGAAIDTSGQGRELPRSYSTSNPGATVGVEPMLDLDYEF